MNHMRTAFLILLLGCSVPGILRAQDAPFVAVDDPLTAFVRPLLLEGMAPDADPVAWPLSQSDLRSWAEDILASTSGANEWLRETAQRVLDRLPEAPAESTTLASTLRMGARLATQDRRDLLRWQDQGELSWQPMVQSTTWLQHGAWTAALGFRVDRYYEVDPDGLDTAHRWLSRAENAYIARNGEFVSFFMGRMARHWGDPLMPGLMLSSNPRPMDHLAFRIGGDRLYVRSVLAELDSFTGDNRSTGTAGADSVRSGSIRRFAAMHQLVVRSGTSWTFGLSHATLYSGRSSGLSLKFLNPFNVALWEVDNRPKNDENNGMVGAFAQFRGTATRGRVEILLDDVDILNGKEPASLAIHASLERRSILSGINAMVHATVVTARAYNAEQPSGRYVYLDRGIALQDSDHIQAGMALEWLRWSGWIVRPGVDLLVQGQQDLNAPLPANLEHDVILIGTEERVIRPHILVMGMLPGGLDVSVDAGWNRIDQSGHRPGAHDSPFTASMSVSYRLNGQRAVR